MSITFVFTVKYWWFSFSVWFYAFCCGLIIFLYVIISPMIKTPFIMLPWKKIYIQWLLHYMAWHMLLVINFPYPHPHPHSLCLFDVKYATIWFGDNSRPGDYNIYYLLQGSLIQFFDRWPPSDDELTFKHKYHVNVQLLSLFYCSG